MESTAVVSRIVNKYAMENITKDTMYACMKLEMAMREMERPSEDVVTVAVCSDTRDAMETFIKIYRNAGKAIGRSLSAKIKKNMTCRNSAGNCYCLGIEKVNKCLNIAMELRACIR